MTAKKLWLSISVVPTIVDQHEHLIIAFVDINNLKEAEKQRFADMAELQQINGKHEIAVERANLLAEEAMRANQTKSKFFIKSLQI